MKSIIFSSILLFGCVCRSPKSVIVKKDDSQTTFRRITTGTDFTFYGSTTAQEFAYQIKLWTIGLCTQDSLNKLLREVDTSTRGGWVVICGCGNGTPVVIRQPNSEVFQYADPQKAFAVFLHLYNPTVFPDCSGRNALLNKSIGMSWSDSLTTGYGRFKVKNPNRAITNSPPK